MGSQFKKELIQLLEEDEDVINIVKKIIVPENKVLEPADNQNMELLKKIKKLEDKLTEITQQRDNLDRELNIKKDEFEKKNTEFKKLEIINTKAIEEKNKATSRCNYYEFRYSELDTIYNKYIELGDSIINRMERILNCSAEASRTPAIFMAYGMQENNIVALWESIATNFDFYDSCGKTQDLVDIFQYFLNLYKEITFKNIMIDWPRLGDIYDERIHTRTTSSNAVGRIEKVILPGFSIGKNIAKKSLVIVK